MMKGNNIEQICLFYARVSTDHTEQDSSLDAQVRLLQSWKKRHPEMYVEATFIERLSGKSDNRPEFQKMLRRIEEGGVAYVLIKDFKRISRSAEVSEYLKKLSKKYGFKFILLSTGEEYDPNTDAHRILYGVESIINEEMVHRQSEYGRIAHRQKCERKVLNRNNVTFGYTWDEQNKTIVIYEEQAEVIREIFDMYVFKSCGVKEIKKYLFERGYNISQPTINKYLQDESYIGRFYLNKRGSELGVGAGEKTKRYFNPKEEWILVERPELAIVDNEIFELALKIRESRTRYYRPDSSGKKQGRFLGTHIFSSKVFCGECGYPYTFGYLDRNQTIPTYRDSFNQKVAVSKCINTEFYRVHEADLKEITAKAIDGMICGSEDVLGMLQSTIKTVLTKMLTEDTRVSELEKKREHLEKRADKTKNKYLEAEGALSKELEKDYNSLVEEISLIDSEIDNLKEASRSREELHERLNARLNRINVALKRYTEISPEDITREIVQSVVERIIINKEGITKVILNGNNISEYQLDVKDNETDRMNQLRMVFSECVGKKEGSVLVPVLRFDVKRTSTYRKPGIGIFDVTVEISIEES